MGSMVPAALARPGSRARGEPGSASIETPMRRSSASNLQPALTQSAGTTFALLPLMCLEDPLRSSRRHRVSAGCPGVHQVPAMATVRTEMVVGVAHLSLEDSAPRCSKPSTLGDQPSFLHSAPGEYCARRAASLGGGPNWPAQPVAGIDSRGCLCGNGIHDGPSVPKR